MNYWEQVSESGGFDIEHISAPPMGLLTYDCEDKRNLFPNRLLGTNLKFHHLTKFNMTNNCISSYRITLVAYDPVTTSLVTFLVGISEEEYARLNLMLFIARLKLISLTAKNQLGQWY
ncbi:UPF0725 protein [Raphanus sativus]|nr:UPF0725 protein [Raphanus sativus]